MKGRSRLDRYQNLRNGMTPNEFTSEDNQLDNNALNNNSAIDSYRSRLNQNSNRTSNYGNGANSRNGLYQTSDYSRLLQEHEEFLRSLDENFGVLNDEVTTQVNNRIENQRPQRVEEVRPQMTAYPHSGYQPHYAAEQPVYQQPEQQPQQPVQTFEQVIDQVVEQITKPVEEAKETVKEIIEPVVEQPVEEPKFVIQPKEVKTVDEVNQTTTPSVSPTYVATLKPVEKPVIEEPKYVIQPKEVKTVDKANQNVTHTVSPTYVTPVKKVEKPVIEEPKYVIQPKEVKGVDSNYIPAHAEKTEQEPTVSKVEKVELPEPTPEIDVAPLTDFTPHVAPLAEVNQLEDFPEEEYLQPELEPASEPEVTEEVTPIIMPVLKPVEEVNEVVEETEETVEEVLGETSDYVEDIVKELEQQIDEQPEQENSEPAVEENSEPAVEEETVEPAVEEEPIQPVVEEENTEPVAEEEYHEPAVEEERTHELPDWIEEEHEDGYVLFTNKDMPHMGFEDEEESAQSLEEVSERVFEKALYELPEGVEEEHEDGYVLFTNKDMPRMGFEEEPEEVSEPEETAYQKPPISIVYGENYGDNYDPYGLGEDTREEDEHKDFLLPDLDEEELQPELTAEEPVEQPETEPVMPEETVIEEPETVIEAEPEETQLAEENQLTEENEKMVFSLEDDIPDLISEELTAEDDIDIDSTLLQLESLKNTHQQPKVEEENINVDEISEEVSKAAEETYDFGEDDESRQVFDYIDDSLDYVDSLGNDDHNPLENTQTNFMLDDESSVDDITSAISQMDLDSYTFSDNDDEYRPQAKMQADLAYQPNNQIDQPLYYDDPEKVNELTEKLNNERELREEILEQTKQLKLQMSEYENEINDANTSMSKTNKILNFVLTLLILLLFVFLLVIGYWFAQERGLI